MIVFGSPIAEPDAYWRYAEPGIRLAAEPDSQVFAFAEAGSLPRSRNLLLDAAARVDELDALVVVHPHAEITDPDFCRKIRKALTNPEVAVVGCVGATGVGDLAWWKGTISSAEITLSYPEYGGGKLRSYSWGALGSPPAEVDAVDGFLFALSPWAVRNLRFDEELVHGYGYDIDFCFQAREAGHKVVTADVRVTDHRSLKLVDEPKVWAEAHMRLAEKWDREDGDESYWRRRARRAEAEREAARAVAHANLLGADARVLALEREFEEKTSSLSWRLTMPLRRINEWRRQRLANRTA